MTYVRLFAAGLLVAALLSSACRNDRQTAARELAGYAPRISFSNFRLSAANNIAGTTVYYLDVLVRNGGDKTIRVLEVDAQFRDLNGQVIFRETGSVISTRRPPLSPGQSRDFRLGFEGIPDSWDRRAPQLKITRMVLE